MKPPLQSHTFTTQLGREWNGLRHRPTALASARAWRATIGEGALARVLEALTDLDEIIEATDGREDVADAALLQLVELAWSDHFAGRIVLQRVMPGLISRAARYRSRRDDIDPAELVVAAAWIAIRRYDTTNRRRDVAARIISDATFQAFRQPLRRRWTSEETVPDEHFHRRPAPTASVTALEQLADVVRVARARGVAAGDLQLVRELVQAGSANLLAVRHGVTPRTIRNRRDRAVANIRQAIRAA